LHAIHKTTQNLARPIQILSNTCRSWQLEHNVWYLSIKSHNVHNQELI